VADLTFVGQAAKGDGLSNPNVLTERGYALKAVGPDRMIGIMNAAYGGPDKLPFNFQHSRHPIDYVLEPKATADQRKGQRSALARRLAAEIQVIFDSGVLARMLPEPKAELFTATTSTSSPATFLEEGEALATIERLGSGQSPMLVLDGKGPKLYLRLLPTTKTNSLTSVEAFDIVTSSDFMPLYIGHDYSYYPERNKFGAIYMAVDAPRKKLISFGQLFRNREIWGMDRHLLTRGNGGDHYIPSGAVERILVEAMDRYRNVARDKLSLPLPLKVIVGATDIANYRLALSDEFDGVTGRMVNPNIEYLASIESYSVSARDILEPFFRQLWDECGIRRPPDFHRGVN
jgi:hypothetical protein